MGTEQQETTHTPGPWKVIQRPEGKHLIRSTKEVVATIDEWNFCPDANARLIAAAPELYEALRDALEDEERRAAKAAVDAGLGASEWENFAVYWFKTGRDAIAKAEGRTP